MAPRALPLALGLLATVLLSCGGSGLDVETPLVFQGDPAGAFGTSVAQFGTSDDGWVLVGAPLERGGANETGAIYRCRFQSGRCQKVPVTGPPGAVNSSLGLALAAGDGGVLACGPTSPQACGVNVHLNGFCVHLDSALQPLRRFPDAFPECPKSSMDIAFLIDGSGSIAAHEFNTMKTFIVEVMKRFQGADVQFSLTQFSHLLHDHFDFRTFRRLPNPELLLRGVGQLRGSTYTATAIRHVLRQMFVPGRGARAGARRILIVVTDGEKFGDQLSYSDVIPLAESMAVTRYAIGVGSAFQTPDAQAELLEIASSPGRDHVFRVDNFDALGDIQNQLQEKIFAIEGTQSAHSSSFQLEMAQEGFSALVTPNGPVLGAVGAYDWSGGVFVYGGGGAPTFVNVSRDLGDLGDMNDAYLGYSVASVALGGLPGLALGAPRFRHLGRVLVFAPGATWKLLAEATGPQVGSYFGAALLPLQPRPGAAPALLVGAPLFYGGGGGGRVDVCELSGKSRHLRCHQTLRGHPGHPLGRFGASLAHLGDLDGDGWAEVAVGAPLEDEGGGAVYLFRGSRRGVSGRDGQRIPGSAFPSRPRFFGQALSGGRDLSGDRLPDVAVGAQGQVLLLRSQPLLKVTVAVTFEPRVVPASAFECPEGEELQGPLATAQICFVGAKKTPDSFGSQISASLRFRAELDPGRLRPRGVFAAGGAARNGTVRVGVGRSCESLGIRFKECPRDTLTPLGLRVTLGGRGDPLDVAGGLRTALSPDSDTALTATLPFENDCGPDNVCQDDLRLSFNFSGLETLVVGEGDALEVALTLRNLGESSFGAAALLQHPASLSYRKVTVLQSSRRAGSVRCHSEPPEGRARRTLCQVHPPVLRAGAQLSFRLTLDVPPDAELGRSLRVVANATSDNGGAAGSAQSAEVAVRYRVLLVLASAPDSTRYLNVTAGAAPALPVTHGYQLQVLGRRGLEANVTFRVPSRLGGGGGGELWESLEVTPEQELPQCQEGPEHSGDPSGPPGESPRLECPRSPCREFRCRVPPADPPKIWGFRVGGRLRLHGMGQPKLLLLSSARVSFDRSRFRNSWGGTELQVQTELERVETPNPLPLILGASLGGLLLLGLVALGLYKVGFFKRRYKDMMETPGDPPAEPPEEPQGDPKN